MQNITSVALSRLIAQQRAMDVTAANLANADTAGYKTERVVFSDWISRQSAAGSGGANGTILYTQDRATYRDQRAGSLKNTDNPLDMALGGDGFFTVQTAQGPRLTRAGHFSLSAGGTIVDGAGNNLLDSAGQPLRVAPTDTRITVAADGSLNSENGPLGRVGVVTPDDPNLLQAEGAQLLRADTPTPQQPVPHLIQGALEESNVQPIQEVTAMTNDLREFQFVTQLLQAESDRVQSVIEKLGTPITG